MEEKSGGSISEKIILCGIRAVQSHGSAIPWLSFRQKSETTTFEKLRSVLNGLRSRS
jgi:hypothetical protein